MDQTHGVHARRRVRAFLIEPEQFLRCVQLLAAGVAFEGLPFPPEAVLIEGAGPRIDGHPVFALILEDPSFDPVAVIETDGGLEGDGVPLPAIVFRLQEGQEATYTPSPIREIEPERVMPQQGVHTVEETRRLQTYAVTPAEALRLLRLLGIGVPLSAPPFPSEMALVYSGYGDDGKFFMICEHPSFGPATVAIEWEDGHLAAIRGRIPQVSLDLGDAPA